MEYENIKIIHIHSDKFGDFEVMVDEDDYEKLIKYKWHVRKCHSQFYESYYVGCSIDGKTTLLHRYIMGVTDRRLVVDHINGDPLDNRKCNLRVCEQIQNGKNKRDNSSNTSGYRGVIWNKHIKTPKWMAYITYNYKKINLGYYDKLGDAIAARKEAEEKYFGEFNRQ